MSIDRGWRLITAVVGVLLVGEFAASVYIAATTLYQPVARSSGWAAGAVWAAVPCVLFIVGAVLVVVHRQTGTPAAHVGWLVHLLGAAGLLSGTVSDALSKPGTPTAGAIFIAVTTVLIPTTCLFGISGHERSDAGTHEAARR